jgi:membrane protease YdiL (CAAX protease family)
MEALIRRRPLLSYFILTFAVSWLMAFAIAAPHLMRHEPASKITGILMFPVMLIGPSLAGVLLTRVTAGKQGLRDLRARLLNVRVAPRYFLLLLLPPVLVLGVLLVLRASVSSAFEPNRFVLGVLFAIPAGVLEEIGWTGYAYPRLLERFNALAAGVLLGLLWSLWHLPVIDYLGAATPHGSELFAFFCSFTAAMTAMRVIMGWMYTNTRSVLLIQLMHISSTASLVVFSPPRATPSQEVLWYALYAVALWIVVAALAPGLRRRRRPLAEVMSAIPDVANDDDFAGIQDDGRS